MTGPEFDGVRATWEDLRLDENLVDDGAYRYRRYGRMRAVPIADGFAMETLPNRPFRQDGIPMWRESERHFAPLDPRTLADPCLWALVAFDLTVAGLVRNRSPSATRPPAGRSATCSWWTSTRPEVRLSLSPRPRDRPTQFW